MKLKTRKSHHLRNTLLLVLALLVAGAAVWLYYTNRATDDSSMGSNPPTAEEQATEKRTDAEQKREFIESTKDQEVPGETVTPPTSGDAITLTSSKDAGMLVISSRFQNIASGKCRLTMASGSRSLFRDADVIYQPEFSTCAGFSIAQDELGSGTWTASLRVTPDGASPIEKSIEVSL